MAFGRSTPDYESGYEDSKVLTSSDLQSQFLMPIIIRILPFFFHRRISGAQYTLITLFVYCHFWSISFTKIGPKFQTLIPNQPMICQSPLKVNKTQKYWVQDHSQIFLKLKTQDSQNAQWSKHSILQISNLS